VRDLAGQEGDPAGLELAALVADPDRHGAVQEQERLVVAAVDVDRRGVAAPGVHLDDGELACGDRGVEEDGDFVAAGPGQPLMPAGLAEVGLWGNV
jgi:hypothetical protein